MKKDKKEENYVVEVTVKWTQVMPALSKTEAIEKTKDTFEEEFNFRPTTKEMKAKKQEV